MQPDLTRQDLNDNWAARPADEVLQSLHTTRRGLEQEEALARLIRFGANQLPEQKQPGFWSKMLAQFNNALIYVLLGATVLTALMQHWIDTWVILGVVIINALIGYIQEEKAQKALDSIKHLLSLKAAVLRGGSRHEVPAEALVPGDIVLLAAGDKIPADVRLIEVSRFSVEESSLTGESEAVDKATEPVEQDTLLGDRRSMAYTGTTVRAGSAVGVVVATASATELGKINTLLAETETMTTPLIRKINRFGQLLSVIIVLFSALLFAFAVWLRHYPISEAIMAVIGLAVAAIPEGLPAILTITLAIGVQRMAQRRAIIRRLPSVETLGSVTVICSDKTGTLTRNEMTVQAIYTTGGMYEVSGAGYEPHGEIRLDGHPVAARQDPILSRLLQAAALCNDAEIGQDDQGQWEVRGTPTEGALKTLAVKAGADTEGQRLAGLPFDSQIKYRATVHQVGDTYLLFANGAPERLLSLCTRQLEPDGTSPVDLAFWERQIETGAASGLRLLGSAYRLLDGPVQSISDDLLAEGLVFIGITGIIDPPRPEAIAAIKTCQAAGITIKMITGDHVLTAQSIGQQMGIGQNGSVISGLDLEKMSDQTMREAVRQCDIFARTSPEHKLRLVSALQANGEICAMTGDGVNDAPALKKADIGVAMGIKGTEVTKDAAAMVLADDNFASIAAAVEEGRTIYDNLRKTLLFMLPTNGAEALVILAAILMGIALPITPVQILWVNMVTAVTLGIALSFEATENQTMLRPPRQPTEAILGPYFVFRILLVSLIIGGLTLAIFLHLSKSGQPLALAQTIAVNTLVAGELFYLFNCRKIASFSLGQGFGQNRVAFISAGILLLIQLCFTYLPFMNALFGTQAMRPGDWFMPLLGGLAVFAIVELEKWLARLIQRAKHGLRR